MLMFKVGTVHWERIILPDPFNDKFLVYSVTFYRGSHKPYHHCLEELKHE